MSRYALAAGISLALARGFITTPHRPSLRINSASHCNLRSISASTSSSDSEKETVSTDTAQESALTPSTLEDEGVASDSDGEAKNSGSNNAAGALKAWLDLGLSPWISERCVELGFDAPTTVQVIYITKERKRKFVFSTRVQM